MCLRCCGAEDLTCSHYHRRGHSATRYCFENCITLCRDCHALWEGPKTEYTEFMILRLGEAQFLELAKKAGQIKNRAEAVAEWKEKYAKMK